MLCGDGWHTCAAAAAVGRGLGHPVAAAVHVPTRSLSLRGGQALQYRRTDTGEDAIRVRPSEQLASEVERICELGVLGTVAFFGGIGFLMWLEARAKHKQREIEHTERMKALEAGLPLPDAAIARANADRSRARALGAIGVLVPLIMASVAIGATLLTQARLDPIVSPGVLLAIQCTVWGVCGLVALVVPLACIGSLGSMRTRPVEQEEPAYASAAREKYR